MATEMQRAKPRRPPFTHNPFSGHTMTLDKVGLAEDRCKGNGGQATDYKEKEDGQEVSTDIGIYMYVYLYVEYTHACTHLHTHAHSPTVRRTRAS